VSIYRGGERWGNGLEVMVGKVLETRRAEGSRLIDETPDRDQSEYGGEGYGQRLGSQVIR